MDFRPCRVVVCICLIFGLGNVGCRPAATGPSYADLVVIYNAEVQALDRLERKRAELLEKIEVITQPSTADKASSALRDLLKTAGELKREHEDLLPADPKEMMDRALENADQVKGIASQVLESVTHPSDEESKAQQEQIIALRVELAELDKEIAKQTERVERAQKRRDAAEDQ